MGVALRRASVIGARKEKVAIASAQEIDSHITGFEAMLRGKQCGEKHIRTTLKLIRRVCAACHFEKPTHITADGVYRMAAEIKASGKTGRTVQAPVVAIKAFTRWL